jgi:hypothetical protein
VGLATRALSEAAQWANERVQFGQPIARFQGTGFKFADGAMEAHLAWLAIVEAAKKMDEGTLTEAEASAANLFASEMLGRATDNALQVLGGMGMSKDAPFERYFRDARVERIWEGTSEIHRHIISKYVLDGATGLDGGGEPVGVDRLDPVQAGGEQQDRRPAVGQVVDRHRTAGEAGVAALGDHGGGVVGAGAHDGLNALDGVGPGDEHRRARVGLPPAGQHRAGVGRVQPPARAEGVAQFGDEYVGHVRSPMGRRV